MKSTFFTKSLAALMGCVSLDALATTAMAQELETVLVTVDRRSENQQDVPVSTSTLRGDRLNMVFQSGMDVKALANQVPSLYAESSNGRVAPRFYIRGLGNSDFDLAASQPVSIIMDGVVMENVVLKSAPLFDLANVEIARGPQGTLFGRNTTAGIISFNSARPTQSEDYYLTGSVGALATANVEGAYSIGLTDTLSFRVSGLWQHRDDYIRNAFTGQQSALGGYEERAGRVQLLWEPSEDFNALLNVHGRSLSGTAAIFRANIFTRGSNVLNANYVDNEVYFDGGANNPAAYNGIGGGLTVTWKILPSIKLTSITGYETTHGYSRGDIDGGNMVNGPGFIPFPSDTQDGLDYLHQFSQELHLASDYANSPFSWQAGAFYFTHDFQNTTDPGFVPPTSVRQGNTSFALFGQASYTLDDLTFTGGVRWTSDVKSMTANGPLIFPGGTQPLVKLRGNYVSWDASVVLALTDDTNVYVRAATGFRAPSIQGRNLAFGGGFSTARSENVMSYEAGLKSDLTDNLRVNLSGFQYYIHNMQFSAVGGAAVGNSIVLLNAKGGEAYGLEADITFVPLANLTFNLGASWTKTAIRDPNLQSGICAQCTVVDPVVGGFAQIHNNPFPQAPSGLLSASVAYTLPLGGGDSLFFNMSWWIQGHTNFFLYESREFYSSGNHQGDLKVGYTWPSGKYELFAYVQNITDEANVQGGIDFNNLTGFVGDPRVFGAGLTVRMN
jgi:outer membrane receptor protein involved in Fe transport